MIGRARRAVFGFAGGSTLLIAATLSANANCSKTSGSSVIDSRASRRCVAHARHAAGPAAVDIVADIAKRL
jgi:hypothetical protein